MTSTYRAVWPIRDESTPWRTMLREAKAELPALLVQAHVRLVGPGRFSVAESVDVPGSGRVTPTVLVFEAPAKAVGRRDYWKRSKRARCLMPWFKVDDKLHDHRKSRKAGKAAMGVWVLAGSWAMDNRSDGFIPADVLTRWGSKADAAKLVAAGLWRVEEFDGERGWRFHDWARFQPSAAVTAAVKAKEAEAGARGNHKRWHLGREISDPDCEYCYRVPDRDPDGLPDEGGESGANRPVPVPEPLRSEANASDVSGAVVEPIRDDVARICEHLAECIERNGVKRPTVTQKWRDSARLMLDRDGRLEQEIHSAIDWCQADEFWRANILSLSKLREKFDQLKLQAQRRGHGASDRDAMFDRQMERAIEREREMGIRR